MAIAPLPPAQGDGDYEPKDGGFKIRFPGKPKETSQTAKSQVGDLKVSTATYATSDGNVFMVSYTDFPAGTAKADISATFFDGVRRRARGEGR